MKKKQFLYVALLTLSAMFTSCSQDNKMPDDRHDGEYKVTITSATPNTRGIADQVQGAGRYPEGETVTLYTNAQKFKAIAKGSADGDYTQANAGVRAVLTSGINQDWNVVIKYYCDVTLDCTAAGGDGTRNTGALEVGTPLPTPFTSSGYTFEGWYDGATKVDKVPDSSNRTMTAKFDYSSGGSGGGDISVSVSGLGYVISPNGIITSDTKNGRCFIGSEVTAYPNDAYCYFIGWYHAAELLSTKQNYRITTWGYLEARFCKTPNQGGGGGVPPMEND